MAEAPAPAPAPDPLAAAADRIFARWDGAMAETRAELAEHAARVAALRAGAVPVPQPPRRHYGDRLLGTRRAKEDAVVRMKGLFRRRAASRV